MAELGGEGEREQDSYARIKLDSYIRAKVKQAAHGPIGIVTVAGMIVDGKGPEGTAAGDSIARVIETAVRDDGLKALVVRVDSPGGSVTASERIRQALLAAKVKDLPVVVSMGNVAASGGYWIATPADFIFAEPSTLTGSIGVFGVLPSFEGTLQKLGVGADGVKSTPLSGEPDLLRGPSPEVDQLLQTGVESTYRRFLAIVAKSRGKSPAEIDRIAQGRVWDGGSARQIGLVDGFGGIEEAVAKAAELAKLDEDDRGVRYLERPKNYTETLLETLLAEEDDDSAQDAFAAFRGNRERMLAQALGDAQMIMNGPTIQARCLECPGTTVRLPRQQKNDLFELIKAWLF
jgi:protease-4